MNFQEFLEVKRIDTADLVSAVSRMCGLNNSDALLLAGSLAEGLGNKSSDIDLYVISSATTAHKERRATVVKGTTLDITIWSREAISAAISSLERWARQEQDPSCSESFDRETMHLFHRLKHCNVLLNRPIVEALQSRIDQRALARLKFACAWVWIKRLQVDLVGFRDERDWGSVLLCSHQLLCHTIDAMLAGHGYTNLGEKWRLKLLQRLDDDWKSQLPGLSYSCRASDFCLELFRLPHFPHSVTSVEYAHRSVAFSRRVCAWASWRLASGECVSNPFSKPIRNEEMSTNLLLPDLELDVICIFSQGRFQIRRLVPGAKALNVDAPVVNALCVHDERVLLGAAEERVIRYLIKLGDLGAAAIMDEEALKTLLD